MRVLGNVNNTRTQRQIFGGDFIDIKIITLLTENYRINKFHQSGANCIFALVKKTHCCFPPPFAVIFTCAKNMVLTT